MCSAWIYCTVVEWRSLLIYAALWYAWSHVLLCLTRNSPHKRDTAFFIYFYFTSLCPAEFCLCQLLPLCSFGAVMPSWKVVTLPCRVTEMGRARSGGGKAIFLVAFGRWHMFLSAVHCTLEFLVYYRDWTWLEKLCSVLCPENRIFKISSKKKKKLYKFCFLHLPIIISHFLSPVLFPVKS